MPRNAPIALQRFRICAKIEPNATAIPEYGSLCGKAYQFQVVGFSFFPGVAPGARQTMCH